MPESPDMFHGKDVWKIAEDLAHQAGRATAARRCSKVVKRLMLVLVLSDTRMQP